MHLINPLLKHVQEDIQADDSLRAQMTRLFECELKGHHARFDLAAEKFVPPSLPSALLPCQLSCFPSRSPPPFPSPLPSLPSSLSPPREMLKRISNNILDEFYSRDPRLPH
jgi:hypothetical protein